MFKPVGISQATFFVDGRVIVGMYYFESDLVPCHYNGCDGSIVNTMEPKPGATFLGATQEEAQQAVWDYARENNF